MSTDPTATTNLELQALAHGLYHHLKRKFHKYEVITDFGEISGTIYPTSCHLDYAAIDTTSK